MQILSKFRSSCKLKKSPPPLNCLYWEKCRLVGPLWNLAAIYLDNLFQWVVCKPCMGTKFSIKDFLSKTLEIAVKKYAKAVFKVFYSCLFLARILYFIPNILSRRVETQKNKFPKHSKSKYAEYLRYRWTFFCFP